MDKHFLPVGSVVMLKGGNKRVLITGRVVAPNTTNEIFDYSGCPFPEGVTSIEQFYCFNRDQIERIYFIGFQDPEELRLQEYLSQLGELVVENGEIVERKEEDAAPESAPAVTEVAPEPAEEIVETAVFADVE